MGNKLVTVVLPVYKTEKYLDRCMNSIVGQTYRELEIIMVDDGSPDRCPEMCDEWAEKDSRVRVIHKQNEGAGMARNTGMDSATGDYICFFDSDDYVHLDTIEKAVNVLTETGADVVCFGFESVSKDGSITDRNVPETEKNFYSGREIKEDLLPGIIGYDLKTDKNTGLCKPVRALVFTADKLRKTGVRFVSEKAIISEDVYFLLEYFSAADSLAVIHEALYCYCENEVSLTHTFRRDRYDMIKIFYDRSMERAESLDCTDAVKKRLSESYFSFTIPALKQIAASDLKLREKLAYFGKVVKDPHLHKVLEGIRLHDEPIARKLFYMTLKYRLYLPCYLLVWAKARSQA